MRNGFWGNGVGRFVLSCTAISAIGLGIGAFGPGFLAWVSKPAQAQDVVVLPKDSKPSTASSVPYMSLVPSAQATQSAQAAAGRETEETNTDPVVVRYVPGLEEALVTTGATKPEEDAALTSAIAAFDKAAGAGKPYREQVAPFEQFIKTYPASNWNMALLTNLGLGFYKAGYYTRTFTAFDQAWQLGRSARSVPAKRLADRAVAELARMHAKVGHADELERLFADIGDRNVSGAATELMAGSREGLHAFRQDQGIAYLCGPKALTNVMRSLKLPEDQVKIADDARSGPNGFSLTQVSALAGKAGVAHKLVFRKPGAAIPVPSVVHWKVNHYAAVVDEINGRYLIKDPTFDSGDLLIDKQGLDDEASGYFLVPTAAAGADKAWREVATDSEEARSVIGMGFPTGQDQYGTKPNDPRAKSCPVPPVTAAQASGGAPNKGMCGSNAHSEVISVNLTDTPSSYAASKGPSVGLTLTYNQREATQDANIPFFNFGQKWTTNWTTYIRDTDGWPGYAVWRFAAGGGAANETYSYFNTTTGVFMSEQQDGFVLKRIPASGTAASYVLTYPDGSTETYQRQTTAGADRKFFLTQRTDAQGNSVTASYGLYTGWFIGGNNQTTDCTAGCVRLLSLTDAAGKVMTFTYGHPDDPLLITGITDPFSRTTVLSYTATTRRLASITDPAGIVSSFGYDTSGLINALNTPYGTTSYAYGQDINTYQRWLTITDPLGFTERAEFNNAAPGIAASDAAATVPDSTKIVTVNGYNNFRNSFYWDKHALPIAQPTPGGAIDYTKAHMRHWVHNWFNGAYAGPFVENEKLPLENRVWYNYPGQPTGRTDSSAFSGSLTQPSVAARVLDDGTTQVTRATYNVSEPASTPVTSVPSSNGKLTSITDGVGRKTVFSYDTTNSIDLLTVQQQISATPTFATLATLTYNTQHLPLTYTDAAGQVWRYAYNTAGQMIYATNPLNQTRFWEYDSSGRLTRVTTPVAVSYASVVYGTTNVSAPTAKSYNYSSPCSGVTAPANTNLPISVTDSEGYTLCYQYDALDRVTKVKYPDGSTDQYDYNFPTGWTANGVNYGGTPSLDVWKVTDRLGRIVNYSYDRNRQLISKSETVKVAGTDVMRTTGYSYYENGVLKELTDANGAVTHWEIDIQSRPTSKTYAYGTANAKTETYTYENTTSRLKSITDAKGQTITYTYNKDNSIASYAYTNAVVATTGASFTYDSWYPRRTGMTDQYGTTSWTYKAVGTNGALGLDTEDGPFSNDTVAYGYDAAGRVNSRTIPGGSTESLTYDLLGRLSTHGTDLGSFTYGYLGNSGQVTSRTVGSVVTSWGYDTNANDRRLLTISTTGAVGRNFTYTSNAYQLTGITDTAPVSHPWLSQTWSYSYDASDRLLTGNGSIAGNSSFGYDKLDNATSFAGLTGTYNNLNQISTFNGTTYTYDNNGNLTSDGTRTYTYDAADRLLTVTQGSAVTTYGYDGLGRRVKRTYVNGTTTNTRYLWCGIAVCQTRDGSDTVTAKLFAEGEYRPSGTKKYLYLTDHLGSVRDVVDITGTPTLVAAFDYTPYGAVARSYGSVVPLYQYAMLVADPNTGLYLSATRAYNPANGKWLSTDSIREAGGINLTGYVGARPSLGLDPAGTSAETMDDGARENFPIAIGAVVVVAVLPWTLPAFAIVGGAFALVGVADLALNWNDVDRRDRILGGLAVGIGAGIGAGLAGGSTGNAGPKICPISGADAARIQRAVDMKDMTVIVVGSRAKGTAGPNSDWDYVLPGGTPKDAKSIRNLLPGGWSGIGEPPARDFDYVLRPGEPHIDFNPRKK